jgi:transcriptional regulator with XRE-family HTH domain
MDAARILRAARARARLTQRALAERSGVPQPTIAAIERGKQDPRFATLERLTRACGQDLDIFQHGGEGEDRTLFWGTLRMTPAERLAHTEKEVEVLRMLARARKVR